MAQDPPADAPSDPQRRARSISIGARKSRPYKVVFEPVVQQQKKLRTDVSFSARPPPDYTFVAAGTPDLTEKCKEYSRQGNHLVYIVSDTKTPSIRLSRHIHRIGHHFLSSIVERACQFLNIALDKWMGTLASASAPAAAQAPTPAVVPKPVATPDPATVTRYLRSRAITRSIDDDRPMTPPPPHVRPSTKASPSRAPESQEMLNDKARDALTDLFPKMPAEDRDLIIARAFDKARKKVGTVNSLPISRRVHLAALAHIRHVYSDYDKLLHTDGWTEARSRVRKICENKLLTWRGDEENGRDVFEEIFREVIYISSDGDDEEFEDAAAEPPGDKAGHATSTTRRPTSTSPGEVQEITSRKRKASPDQVRSYHAPAQRHEETDRQPTEVNLESNIRNQIVQRVPFSLGETRHGSLERADQRPRRPRAQAARRGGEDDPAWDVDRTPYASYHPPRWSLSDAIRARQVSPRMAPLDAHQSFSIRALADAPDAHQSPDLPMPSIEPLSPSSLRVSSSRRRSAHDFHDAGRGPQRRYALRSAPDALHRSHASSHSLRVITDAPSPKRRRLHSPGSADVFPAQEPHASRWSGPTVLRPTGRGPVADLRSPDALFALPARSVGRGATHFHYEVPLSSSHHMRVTGSPPLQGRVDRDDYRRSSQNMQWSKTDAHHIYATTSSRVVSSVQDEHDASSAWEGQAQTFVVDGPGRRLYMRPEPPHDYLTRVSTTYRSIRAEAGLHDDVDHSIAWRSSVPVDPGYPVRHQPLEFTRSRSREQASATWAPPVGHVYRSGGRMEDAPILTQSAIDEIRDGPHRFIEVRAGPAWRERRYHHTDDAPLTRPRAIDSLLTLRSASPPTQHYLPTTRRAQPSHLASTRPEESIPHRQEPSSRKQGSCIVVLE